MHALTAPLSELAEIEKSVKSVDGNRACCFFPGV